MSEDASFRDLILKVRAGDEAAATELVRRYEPAIRRTIRVRLRDPRLGRLFDSMDICQSVMASFFVRAALGQYQLEEPEHLLKLLATMARNKLANQANRHQAQCRDHRRIESMGTEGREVLAREATPYRQTAARELLQEARRRMTAEERKLLELREQGHEWGEIAVQVNGSAEALRKKLTRAIERVAQQLGLDEMD